MRNLTREQRRELRKSRSHVRRIDLLITKLEEYAASDRKKRRVEKAARHA